jgi:epimerase transport system membrane fusion protein
MGTTLSMAPEPLRIYEDAAHRMTRRGLLCLALAALPIGAWLALAPLASAVIATGVVAVEHSRSPVQHAQGGTVREVRVRDGQVVARGDLLLVLGDVAVDADMQRWDARVRAERASIARLDAEQALAQAIRWPPELAETARNDPGLASLLTKEQALFDARRGALAAQTALLRTQKEKLQQEVAALTAQIGHAGDALALQGKELASNRELVKEGFISATRVSQIEAQVADYGVKLEERRGELARAGQRMVDTDLRIESLNSEYRQQASDQLKVTLARLAEIQQEQRKTADAASRQVIRAPAAGTVIGLKVNAPGAVIAAQDVVAEIVPSQRRLIVEAQLRTEDIERVHLGQGAEIRFGAFSHRTTQLVQGKVAYVSADRLVDRDAGTAFYLAHIEVDPSSLRDAGSLQLLPGMPAEVFISGTDRTPLQYLVEPLTQVMHRAGRER